MPELHRQALPDCDHWMLPLEHRDLSVQQTSWTPWRFGHDLHRVMSLQGRPATDISVVRYYTELLIQKVVIILYDILDNPTNSPDIATCQWINVSLSYIQRFNYMVCPSNTCLPLLLLLYCFWKLGKFLLPKHKKKDHQKLRAPHRLRVIRPQVTLESKGLNKKLPSHDQLEVDLYCRGCADHQTLEADHWIFFENRPEP